MAQEYIRRFTGRDGQTVELIVLPPVPDADDWRCVYRINGLDTPGPKAAMGADAIQAITLALTYAATTLYYSQAYEKGELTWEGGATLSDLGLPVAESVRDDVEVKKIRVDQLLQTNGSIS